MRIWDLDPAILCRQHLLGEHRELHAIWSILTKDKKGYRRHPETIRWIGRTKALFLRHGLLVEEMEKRGYHHHSPLAQSKAKDQSTQDLFVNTPDEQIAILRGKKCDCLV